MCCDLTNANFQLMEFSFTFNTTEIFILSVAILLLLLQLFYDLFFYLRLSRFFKSESKGKIRYSTEQPAVSVIIYAKNDAENLEKFLPSILDQNYPNFEVIVVNDGSTDDTKNITSFYETRYNNLYQTYIPEEARNLSRIKLALTVGIKAAKNEILLFTHANCEPASELWISKMVRNFTPGTDIVLGYTYFEHQRQSGTSYICFDQLMHSFQYLSFALLDHPYMGQGTNLAYRKTLFFENKGFSRHLNLHFGDDDLFINEIANTKNTRVEISPESQMSSHFTNLHQAWKEQKLQYAFTRKYLKTASKWIFTFESLSRLAFYAAIILLMIGGAQNFILIVAALLVFIIHYILQMTLFRRTARQFSVPSFRFYLPIFELINPFINLYYRLLGLFSRSKNYTWKVK